MPLWLSLPVLAVLGVLSWIATLDPMGDAADSYLLWGATAIAAALLALRWVIPDRE